MGKIFKSIVQMPFLQDNEVEQSFCPLLMAIELMEQLLEQQVPVTICCTLTSAPLLLFEQLLWELCHVLLSFSAYEKEVRDQDR